MLNVQNKQRIRSSPRFYRVSGLIIGSEIDIPELGPVACDGGEPDARLRLGDVPTELPGAHDEEDGCQWSGGDVLLTYGDTRFLVRDGREIIVEPGARDGFARVVLLANPLSVLFQQRGLLPVHASAVMVAGKAVAFAAPTGGGKSTLLAWLLDRGFTMMSDDLCIVEQSEAGFAVRPSFPVVKLRGDVVARAGKWLVRHGEALPAPNKHLFTMSDGFTPDPAPLAAIYFLRWSPDGSAPAIRRLTRIFHEAA